MMIINKTLEHDILSPEEESELLFKYRNENDEESFERLIECNQRLIVKVIKDINVFDYELFEDLIQEGNIGLIEGIRRFDLESSSRLSTYSYHWIKNKVLRYLKNKKKQIRIPEYQHNVISLYKKGVDIDKIAVSTTTRREKVLEIINDFEAGLYDDEYLFRAVYSDNGSVEYENKIIEKVFLDDVINEVFSKLSEKEYMFLKYKFGINCEVLTEKEISYKFNYSRQYINLACKNGLDKIKKGVARIEKFNKRPNNN